MNWNVAFVLVTALVAFHLLTLLAAYRLRATGVGGRSAAAADSDEHVNEDGVACPNCGTENEPDYRFCRRCVSELPHAVAAPGKSAAPSTPGVR